MMSRDAENQKPDKGFTNIGDIAARFRQGILPLDEETGVPLIVAPKAPSPIDDKLAVAAREIALRPPNKDLGEIVYTMREFVQCSFPIRDPGDVQAWTRKNGDLTLVIQPGIDPETGQSLGIPRGEWPRLFMRFFQKQAFLTKRRGIYLGSTTNEVIRLAGGNDTSRGKNSTARQMLTELNRLIHARITVHRKGDATQLNPKRRRHLDMPVTAFGDTWWTANDPDQLSLFKSEIILGEVLFEMFLDDPIPVDLRVLLALKNSLRQASFAMDIYDFQQSHLYWMRKSNRADLQIQWEYLPDQFGAEFKRSRDWKASFSENFNHVERLSPALTHEFDGKYLILRDTGAKASLQPVSRRKMERLVNQISPKARDWFFERYPLHASDLGEVEAAFNYWRDNPRDGEPIISRDPDKHFQHFVRHNWFNEPKIERGV